MHAMTGSSQSYAKVMREAKKINKNKLHMLFHISKILVKVIIIMCTKEEEKKKRNFCSIEFRNCIQLKNFYKQVRGAF